MVYQLIAKGMGCARRNLRRFCNPVKPRISVQYFRTECTTRASYGHEYQRATFNCCGGGSTWGWDSGSPWGCGILSAADRFITQAHSLLYALDKA
ncbi:hypothetical protein A0H81_06539 [Grifola frondosa]|uniref:Uncharacterized protein n=1 Tax=Grifola frondosa TaxID=5627 RepID=A0A1C7MAQ0_GRIFR|nr:hypothetical protein A0H81_06539 [Grifola frondosa]